MKQQKISNIFSYIYPTVLAINGQFNPLMAITICSSSTHSPNLPTIFQPKSTHYPHPHLLSSKPCFNLASDNNALVSAAETASFASSADGKMENNLGYKGGRNELERDWRHGLGVRRKRRRKRRNLEIEKDGYGEFKQVSFRCKNPGQYLNPKEEAEYTLFIKEEARLEAVRRRILETSNREPTLNQWADAVGMRASSLDKILCRGTESRERINESYRRLVVSIACGYQGRGLNLQDLIQEGSIGLLRGAEKFDPERGYKLSTYVYWWIRQAVSKAIANNSRTIRLPGSICEMIPKIAEANNILSARLRRSPSHDEIAELVCTSVATVRVVYRSTRDPISLDRAVTTLGCLILQDIMPGPKEITPETMVRKHQMKQDLEKLLNLLCDREARVLRLHYGLNGDTPRSHEEIGRLLKLSRERIRQIKGIALSKLQQSSMVDDMRVYIEI